MWTTKITSVLKNKLTLDYTVEFYKDGILRETFVFKNVSKPESIKRLIYDQLNQYKKLDETPIETGDVDLTVFDPKDPEEVVLTPEQIAYNDYVTKFHTFRKLRLAIELGLITDTNQRYENLLKYLKTNFDPNLHLDLLN